MSFATLTDGKLCKWDGDTLRDGGAELDAAKVTGRGTFDIAQGVPSGARGIDGAALVEFLQGDTNGLATFILVREAEGTGRSDRVHGFASKDQPTLAPPTLRLSVAP